MSRRGLRLNYDTDSDVGSGSDSDAPDSIGSNSGSDHSDMFASDEETAKKEAKPVDPLDVDEFERENALDQAVSDESEVLEPFSLRNDLAEGAFDDEGNFIRHSPEPIKDEDRWIDDFSESDLKKASEARQASKERDTRVPLSIDESLERLVPLLSCGESPLEALASTKDVERINEITDRCEDLAQNGVDAYDMSCEELSRLYTRRTGVEVPRGKKRKLDEYEFRWVGEEEIHGPHTAEEMVYWRDNYFGGKAEGRRVGEKMFVGVDELTLT